MKVVISTRGDFTLSLQVIDKLLALGYPTITEKDFIDSYYDVGYKNNIIITDIAYHEEYASLDKRIHAPVRNDALLIQVIESIGVKDAAFKDFCKLKIIEIPDDVQFDVEYGEFSPNEIIVEKHRTWE